MSISDARCDFLEGAWFWYVNKFDNIYFDEIETSDRGPFRSEWSPIREASTHALTRHFTTLEVVNPSNISIAELTKWTAMQSPLLRDGFNWIPVLTDGQHSSI